MTPILFEIGPFPVGAYGFMLVLGFLAGYLLLRRDLAERGAPGEFAATVLSGGMITGIVGSRLFHVLENLGAYSGRNLHKIFVGPGFSWYGGFLLTAVTMIILARRRKIHWTTLIDAASPALIVGYGFGRIGCFISGDGCYGVPCASLDLHWPVPFCMAFPNGAVPTREVVVNAPILELIGAIALFAYLELVRRRVTIPAGLFARMLVAHAAMRFAVEFVRLNPKLALGLTQAQWVSIAGVGIAAWLMRIGPRIKVPPPERRRSGGKRR
jgi:phosphatidylglycerol---prolipoprotein diacylglyceryl transferase